jgi:hypothetical protein
MLPGRTAKRRRTEGPEGPAGDARDPTLRIALALHEEHGIVFDEVVATFNALGRDSRGRTTLEEIDALSEGRRFCATMNASVSLRRIFSRLGDFVPRGDTVKDDEGAAAGRGGGGERRPARDARRASSSCSAEGSLVPTSSDDSGSEISGSCEPSPACDARALDEPAFAAPSGRGHSSGARVSFIGFCHGVLAAAQTMEIAPRSSLDTLRGSLDELPAADDDDGRRAW